MKQFIISTLAKWAKFEWFPKENLWKRSSVAGTSAGATGALMILAKVFGISAVVHSSGGLILSGSAGYIAGTFIAGSLIWVVFPIVVLAGIVALFGRSIWNAFVRAFDWLIRKLYFWRNQE